jgi:hypothetical protein
VNGVKGVLVAGLLVLAGCSAGARSPEGAVRRLADAAAAGDRDAVWSLLGPSTKARLEAEARRATPVGRRALTPSEMLAVGWEPARFRLTDIRLRERRGDEADVEVRGPDGQLDRVTCVRVADRWTVELSPPPAPVPAAASP